MVKYYKWTLLLCTFCFVLDPPRPFSFNPLNAELNPICHLLALLGAHLIFHVSRIRVNKHRNIKRRNKLPPPE